MKPSIHWRWKNKIDAGGKHIKPGRSGLGSSVLWLCATDRIWSIFAIRLYDSKESLHSTVSTRALRLFLAAVVKISKGAVAKVPEVAFQPPYTHAAFSSSPCPALYTSQPLSPKRYPQKPSPSPTTATGWAPIAEKWVGTELGCWGRSTYQRKAEIRPLVTLPPLKSAPFRVTTLSKFEQQQLATARKGQRADTRLDKGETAGQWEQPSGIQSQLCHLPSLQFPFSSIRPKDT